MYIQDIQTKLSPLDITESECDELFQTLLLLDRRCVETPQDWQGL